MRPVSDTGDVRQPWVMTLREKGGAEEAAWLERCCMLVILALGRLRPEDGLLRLRSKTVLRPLKVIYLLLKTVLTVYGRTWS